MKRESARNKIRSFLEANVGKKVTTHQIQEAAGYVSEYGRRLRELRNDEGMQIKTHNDRPDLRPDEYILETLDRTPKIGRGITLKLRNEIMERNGYSCQLCGATGGDPDPCDPKKKVRLQIDHILPFTQNGPNDKDNLEVLCSVCNQSKSNILRPSESALNLIARIRRNPQSVQREVFEMLKKKFGDK